MYREQARHDGTDRRSAQTLPDRPELIRTTRNPLEHKLLRVLQGLVNIGAPEGFDPPNLHHLNGCFGGRFCFRSAATPSDEVRRPERIT